MILDGTREPAHPSIGFMPAFRRSLNDRQVATLAGYMRERFAPGRPAWRDLEPAVAAARASPQRAGASGCQTARAVPGPVIIWIAHPDPETDTA